MTDFQKLMSILREKTLQAEKRRTLLLDLLPVNPTSFLIADSRLLTMEDIMMAAEDLESSLSASAETEIPNSHA